MGDLGEIWECAGLREVRKSGKIQKIPENSGKIGKNPEESGKNPENPEKSGKLVIKSGRIRKENSENPENSEKNPEESGKNPENPEKSGKFGKNPEESGKKPENHGFGNSEKFCKKSSANLSGKSRVRKLREIL